MLALEHHDKGQSFPLFPTKNILTERAIQRAKLQYVGSPRICGASGCPYRTPSSLEGGEWIAAQVLHLERLVNASQSKIQDLSASLAKESDEEEYGREQLKHAEDVGL